MRYTTINKILEHDPCSPSRVKRLAGIIDYNAPISFKQIYAAVSNLGNTLWCIRTLDYDVEIQAFVLRCSRLVEHYDGSGAAKRYNDALEMYLNGDVSLDAFNNAMSAIVKVARSTRSTRSTLAASTASVALVTSTANAARSEDIVKQIEADFLATFCREPAEVNLQVESQA